MLNGHRPMKRFFPLSLFAFASEVFWTVVPVLPTTENWVAPFRVFEHEWDQ